MSWDSYIDNLLAQTKDSTEAARACIIGFDGALWTTAAHPAALKLQVTEARTIARCFKWRDFSTFMTSGVRVEGLKYQFLRVQDDKTVYAMKMGSGAVTLQASKTAIVIAHCPERSQQGNVNKGVGVIAEYLESLNM